MSCHVEIFGESTDFGLTQKMNEWLKATEGTIDIKTIEFTATATLDSTNDIEKSYHALVLYKPAHDTRLADIGRLLDRLEPFERAWRTFHEFNDKREVPIELFENSQKPLKIISNPAPYKTMLVSIGGEDFRAARQTYTELREKYKVD